MYVEMKVVKACQVKGKEIVGKDNPEFLGLDKNGGRCQLERDFRLYQVGSGK